MHNSKEEFDKDMKFISDWLDELEKPPSKFAFLGDFFFWLIALQIILVITLIIKIW